MTLIGMTQFVAGITLQPAVWVDCSATQTGHGFRNDLYCVEWGVKLYSLTHGLFYTGGMANWNVHNVLNAAAVWKRKKDRVFGALAIEGQSPADVLQHQPRFPLISSMTQNTRSLGANW